MCSYVRSMLKLKYLLLDIIFLYVLAKLIVFLRITETMENLGIIRFNVYNTCICLCFSIKVRVFSAMCFTGR